MNILEMRKAVEMTQKAFSEYLNVPKRTLEDWENDRRRPPVYVVELIEYKLRNEKLLK